MALAIISSQQLSSIDTEASSVTGTVTVPALCTYALAFVSWGHFAAVPDLDPVTLGGTTMPSLGVSNKGTLGGFPTGIQCFKLVDPPTGAVTLTVPYFGFNSYSGAVTIVYFSGEADGTTEVGFMGTGTGTGTTVTATPTGTTVAGDIAIAIVIANQAAITSLSTSDTEVSEQDLSAGADIISGVAAKSLTGSGQSVSFTLSTSVAYRYQVLIVKAAVGAGTAYFKTVSGTLTMTGSVRKKTRKTPKGTITSTGSISKAISKSFSGVISMSATLLNGVSLTQLLTGSITMSGGVSKLIRKGLFGSMDMVGVVSKKTTRTLTGVLTLSGDVYKKTSRLLSGSLTVFANLITSTRMSMALSGTLTLIGSLASQIQVYVEAVLGNNSNLNFIRRFIGRR